MDVYKAIVQNVLGNGITRTNRTGIDTISVFGLSYEIELQHALWPLMTLRELSPRAVLAELRWFLSGARSVTELNNYTGIWKPWMLSDGTVPSAYGHAWRSAFGVDQIKKTLECLRKNPDSRRMVVTAWDPTTAWNSTLPPCHMTFVLGSEPCYRHSESQRTLNLALFQRSCDIGIGLPWNIACYTALMHLFAKLTNHQPGKFVHSIVDAHIYVNHERQLRELIRRESQSAPLLEIDEGAFNQYGPNDAWLDAMSYDVFLDAVRVSEYRPWPSMKFDVAV